MLFWKKNNSDVLSDDCRKASSNHQNRNTIYSSQLLEVTDSNLINLSDFCAFVNKWILLNFSLAHFFSRIRFYNWSGLSCEAALINDHCSLQNYSIKRYFNRIFDKNYIPWNYIFSQNTSDRIPSLSLPTNFNLLVIFLNKFGYLLI